MQTYNIIIDDAQRSTLSLALRTARDLLVIQGQARNAAKLEEITNLLALIDDLPAQERAAPRITHGLCY